MPNFRSVKLTDVNMYQIKYLVYVFTAILSLVSKLLEESGFLPIFYVNININGQQLMLKKNVAETHFNLQFDIVMVQNSFHII